MKKAILTLLTLVFVNFAFCNPIAVMETTEGTVEIELKPDIAPKTCENMIKLAEKKYYDGTIFHRVIPGFMIQGGDPTGTGRGGQSAYGKPFEDECSPKVRFDKVGLLAMANSGKNTNGSQFFITTSQTTWLNDHHTIFGEVTKGMEVVRKIESFGSKSGATSKDLKINRLYIKQK